MASLNSPLSSILKTSRLSGTSIKKVASPMQVRFDAQATVDILKILEDHIEGRHNVFYAKLLDLKTNPTPDGFLLLILQQLNKSIGILVPKVELFVDALLSVSWTNRSLPVIEEYLCFVKSLVSAHSYYCKSVITMVVSKFVMNPDTDKEALRHVHDVLADILSLIPLSQSIVWNALMECFPRFGADTTDQTNYVRNLLSFSEYCPPASNHVLKLIISRIVKLDSRVPREELLRISSNENEMDCDEPESLSQDAKTLDALMSIMFDHCVVKCKSDWSSHQVFYRDMLSSFEEIIVPASGIHHAHFLMFYVCSTKPALYEAFIDRLWNLFETPSTQFNVRKTSVDYLASFLGKANFIPMKIVTFCLEKVCKWIHSYLIRQKQGDGAAVFKIRAHSAFYAACHIPFYVIAARHSEFLGNRKLLASLQTLDLALIVNSPLNPLRFCHATTVRQFAESASHLQVVFCHTIMIRNQRLGSQEGSADALTLNTEYPFEKYLLPGSDKYVDSLLVDKPIGRVDSLYDSDQVMEELLSESPRVGGFMHHFLG